MFTRHGIDTSSRIVHDHNRCYIGGDMYCCALVVLTKQRVGILTLMEFAQIARSLVFMYVLGRCMLTHGSHLQRFVKIAAN